MTDEKILQFYLGWCVVTRSWETFESEENKDALLKLVAERGGPLSSSSFDVAFKLLRQQGKLKSVSAAPVNAADVQRDAEAVPLDNRLYNELCGMSKSEVSEKYFSDQVFRALYDRAARKWFFEIPSSRSKSTYMAPGTSRRAAVAAHAVESKPVPTNSREYYEIPTSEVIRRFRIEPAFRDAVNSLIASGAI